MICAGCFPPGRNVLRRFGFLADSGDEAGAGEDFFADADAGAANGRVGEEVADAVGCQGFDELSGADTGEIFEFGGEGGVVESFLDVVPHLGERGEEFDFHIEPEGLRLRSFFLGDSDVTGHGEGVDEDEGTGGIHARRRRRVGRSRTRKSGWAGASFSMESNPVRREMEVMPP